MLQRKHSRGCRPERVAAAEEGSGRPISLSGSWPSRASREDERLPPFSVVRTRTDSATYARWTAEIFGKRCDSGSLCDMENPELPYPMAPEPDPKGSNPSL